MSLLSLLEAFWPLSIFILLTWAVARALKKSANKHPPAAPELCNVAGVGGWLLLLVAGLMFLGPLMGAGRINSDFLTIEDKAPNLKTAVEWVQYKSVTRWSFFFFSCLSFYGGLGLLRQRKAAAVSRAIVILWVVGPLASLVLGIFIPHLVLGRSALDSNFIGTLIASVLGATIWSAYLVKSKRVKATYGVNT